jgi:hypothetical protein
MIERHFRRKDLRWTEEYFVAALDSPRKHDVYWATIALRDCGTMQCVPALRAKLSYPMKDVKCTSLLTIAHLAGASETPLYAEALLDASYPEKGYAMWAIRDAADERAVDAVLAYFRQNRAKIRRGELTNATLPDGIDYLSRYAETRPAIHEFFGDIRLVWTSLASGERNEIIKRVPNFMQSEL